MRVLFSVSDYAAHYFPMVPLGWALQAAGHEVLVACAPSEQATLARAGLTPAPVLGGPDMMERGRIFYYFAAKTGGCGPLGMPLHPVTGAVLDSFDQFDWAAYKRDNKGRNIGAGTGEHGRRCRVGPGLAAGSGGTRRVEHGGRAGRRGCRGYPPPATCGEPSVPRRPRRA